MATKHMQAGACALALFAAACAPKRAAAPPPAPAPAPKQNVFALLPEPEGASTGIAVRNQAGVQDLTQPNQAVRVERSDVAPSAPFPVDQAEVRRLFGSALDVVPAAEVRFVLNFDQNQAVLNARSEALLPGILQAIRDRKSTAITVIGHTDTTGSPEENYQLGLKRAEHVAGLLRKQGVNESDVFISSHGQADLLVKTPPNRPLEENRRVEVIVR
jgi:outer membrane protein OmpA-like peptidoglycan-associated protein